MKRYQLPAFLQRFQTKVRTLKINETKITTKKLKWAIRGKMVRVIKFYFSCFSWSSGEFDRSEESGGLYYSQAKIIYPWTIFAK